MKYQKLACSLMAAIFLSTAIPLPVCANVNTAAEIDPAETTTYAAENIAYQALWQINGVNSYDYHLMPGQTLQIQPILTYTDPDTDENKTVSPEDYQVAYNNEDDSVITVDANGTIQAKALGESQVNIRFYMDGSQVDDVSFSVYVKKEVSAVALCQLFDDGDETRTEILAEMPACENGDLKKEVLITAPKGTSIALRPVIKTYTEDNPGGYISDYPVPTFDLEGEYKYDLGIGSGDTGIITITDSGFWGYDEENEDYPYRSFYGEIRINGGLFCFPYRIRFEDTDSPEEEGDYLYLEQEDGTVQILKYKGNDTAVTVPKQIAGKTVTSIGTKAFRLCENITSVKLPSTITYIGVSAFAACFNLTSLELPTELTTLDESAFISCTKLTGLKFPAKLTTIGNHTFMDCRSLTSLEFPAGLTSIGYNAFLGCRGLTNVELPAKITSVASELFSECINLKSVKLPAGVTSIGNSAFSDCNRLTSLKLPAGVTSIGQRAFTNCNNLTTLNIPSSVNFIDPDAPFQGCDKLVLELNAGSYAETYAKANNLKYKYTVTPEIQAARTALNATKISKTALTLYTGKVTHTATIKPTYPKDFTKTLKKAGLSIQSVAYKSNVPKTASVNKNGTVTGLKAGNAAVTTTVTLSDGSKKTLKTNVTIKAPYLKISGNSSVKKGKKLALKVKKYGVSGTATWSVNKPKLAKINKKTGKLTAKATGTVKVTVKVGKTKTSLKVKIKK